MPHIIYQYGGKSMAVTEISIFQAHVSLGGPFEDSSELCMINVESLNNLIVCIEGIVN